MVLGCFAGFVGFDCSMLWIIMILLFFICAIARRQLTDLIGTSFNLIISVVVSEIAFIASIYISHSMKWSFLIGIVGSLVGGFLGGSFLGEDEGGWY